MLVVCPSKAAMLPETNVHDTNRSMSARNVTETFKVILLNVCSLSTLIVIRSY